MMKHFHDKGPVLDVAADGIDVTGAKTVVKGGGHSFYSSIFNV